jgi:hypothetical protein
MLTIHTDDDKRCGIGVQYVHDVQLFCQLFCAVFRLVQRNGKESK